jgi:hypothetical protein
VDSIDPAWDGSWVSATCEELAEDADGEPGIDEYHVDGRHAAKPEHALSHEEWIKQAGLSDFRIGSEIWKERGDFYPNLQFLPRVEEQLSGLRPDWVIPVAHRLRTLNEAITEWVPGSEPPWRTKVTPESEQRKRLCMFVDLDSIEWLFRLAPLARDSVVHGTRVTEPGGVSLFRSG